MERLRMTAQQLSGRCSCGAVRFTAMSEPLWVAHCHCCNCRGVTGTAFATYAGYATEKVAWTGDAPSIYRSSPGVVRQFCGKCGTPLSFAGERWPGEIHLFVCTLDDPGALQPTGHVYVKEQMPWLHLADRLPRFHTVPSQGGPLAD